MTTVRTHLLMTTAERALGRYMRAPDGHGDNAQGAGTPPAEQQPLQMAEIEVPAEAPASTTEEDLEKEFGQVQTPATETEDGGEPKVEGEPGEKPKSDVQTRMDEMTAARREAERVAAEATRQAEYWRGKAEALAPKTEGDKATVDPDAQPDPATYEFGEADAKFIADTARYHARAEFRSQQQEAELKAQVSQMEASWTGNVAKVTERLPDFKEKVLDTADKGEWPCSPVVTLGIKSSAYGPDVAYHLATNIDEAKRIAALTPIEQAREFGRLEYRFETEEKARAAPKTNVKNVTNAPTPPSGQARGVGGKFAVSADTDDFSAFDKAADSMMRR